MERKVCRLRRILFAVCAILVFAAQSEDAAAQQMVIVGTGSTVPNPLYSAWTPQYNKLDRAVQMRYLPIGTAEGISQASRGVSDFGAGEALLSEQQRSQGRLIAIPTVLIGIVPIYNLPGVTADLRFSGDVLAGIFLGEIKAWNDNRIADLNPHVRLPKLGITVVNRPAGKGSNFVFTDFLSKINPQFRARIGKSASPKWPVGMPAERSSDMVDKVKGQPGAIGYVELNYAATANVAYGAVQNAAGKFVRASQENIRAACVANLGKIGDEFSVSLTNAAGAASYPITSFSWIYLRRSGATPARQHAVLNLLDWMLSDGQAAAERQGYAALPDPLVSKVRAKIYSLR